MAKIVLKSNIKSIHGRTGNLIYYNVKGYQYARAYSIPLNPRTEAQQQNRTRFAQAVLLWHKLPHDEKTVYDRLTIGKSFSGYNLFISNHMKGITHEKIMLLIDRLEGASLFLNCSLLRDHFVSPPLMILHSDIHCAGTGFMLKKPPGVQISRDRIAA